MIRHIVSWTLKAVEPEARSVAAAEIAEAFEALVPLIPEILSLTVARSVASRGKNHDVVLIVDVASLEDLEAYQVHPAHIRAAGVVGARVSSRAGIDIEV